MGNCKDGAFHFEITFPRPLTETLQILIDSSITKKKDKAFFGKLKDEVTVWVSRAAKGEKTTKQDVDRISQISVKLSTIVRTDCQARLAFRRLHPNKTSSDTVMDDKLAMISKALTYAIKEIHEFLVYACRKDDFWNYKGGIFGSRVVMTKPILSCLQILIDSPRLEEEEKAVFITTRDRLASLTTKVEPVLEMLDLADYYCGLMQIAFEQDQKARFFTPDKHIYISDIPGYKGNDDDIPSKLMALAHQILIIGIKETNYLGGKLKDNIAVNTDLCIGLSFLTTNNTVPSLHQKAFEAAKLFVHQLKEYKDEGLMDLFPTGMLHLDFIQWFNPICALFTLDAKERKHHTGNWPMLAMTACDKKLRSQKDAICSLGTYVGHPLFPDEIDHTMTAVPRNGGPKSLIRPGIKTIDNTIYPLLPET